MIEIDEHGSIITSEGVSCKLTPSLTDVIRVLCESVVPVTFTDLTDKLNISINTLRVRADSIRTRLASANFPYYLYTVNSYGYCLLRRPRL